MSSFALDADYIQWVRQDLRMIIDPRLEVRKFCDGEDERGIYTTSALPPNSTLAIAPLTALLTTQHARSIPILSEISHLLREDDLLVLIMVYERYLGESSQWARHFALLPKQYHSIINYSQEELAWIRGSNLFTIANQWQKQVLEDYEGLSTILQKHSLHTHPAYVDFSHTTYLWCLSTIWSRFITITVDSTQYRAMVPFVDFLNHSPTSTVCHQIRPYYKTPVSSTNPSISHVDIDKSRPETSSWQQNSFVLYAHSGFPANCEVFLNYGLMGNMRSLMLYGFALKDNPYDGVEIYVSLNPSSTEHYSLKLALLDKLALSSHRSLYNNSDSNNNEGDGDAGKKSPWRRFVLAAGDKERSLLPKELMVFLRVQQLDKKTLLTSSKKLLEALAAGLASSEEEDKDSSASASSSTSNDINASNTATSAATTTSDNTSIDTSIISSSNNSTSTITGNTITNNNSTSTSTINISTNTSSNSNSTTSRNSTSTSNSRRGMVSVENERSALLALQELLEQSLLAYPPLQTNTNTSSISEEGAFVHPMHRQIHAGFLLAAERLILAAAASLCAAQLAQLAGEKKKMTP